MEKSDIKTNENNNEINNNNGEHFVVVNKLEVSKQDEETGFSDFKVGVCLPGVIYSEVLFYSINNETINSHIAVKMALKLQKFVKELADEYEALEIEAHKQFKEANS